MKKKIAHILLLDALGGVENWYLDLAQNSFFSEDHEHVVYCISSSPNEELINRFEQFVRVVKIPRTLKGLMSFVYSNRKELKSVNWYYNHTYLRGFKIILILKIVFKSKIINHVHSHALKSIKKKRHRIGANIINRVYRLLINKKVAVSKEAALEFFGTIRKVSIIPCFFKKYEVNNPLSAGIRSNELKLIHIGRFYHSDYFLNAKNQSFIVDILYQLRTRGVSCKMTFCGGGDTSFVEGKIDFYGLNRGCIEFIDWVDPLSFLPEHDIFLFPSNHEGYGLALLEAQLSNLFTISSDKVPSEPFSSYPLHYFKSLDDIKGWVDLIEMIGANRSELRRCDWTNNYSYPEKIAELNKLFE